MKVAVLQSNYAPWKGYFDLMDAVDVFVIYDCVQYTKNDWRNRNKVMVNGQPRWLTVPVAHTALDQLIQDTRTAGGTWARKHWSTLQQHYARAAGFGLHAQALAALYEKLAQMTLLSDVNRALIAYVCEALGITTRVVDARELAPGGNRVERLVQICSQLNASTYISGPAARNYLDEAAFERAGIQVQWFEYGPYPEYAQAGDPFVHQVSVLDLLLRTGREAGNYFRGAKRDA